MRNPFRKDPLKPIRAAEASREKLEAAYKLTVELLEVMEQEKNRFEGFIETAERHLAAFRQDRDQMQTSIDLTRVNVATLKTALLKLAEGETS